MKKLWISRSDLIKLGETQAKRRRNWLAVFSTNCCGQIWIFVTRGWTPFEKRIEPQRLRVIVRRIADEYCKLRPEGGRFFINETGAFYKPAEKREKQFLSFE